MEGQSARSSTMFPGHISGSNFSENHELSDLVSSTVYVFIELDPLFLIFKNNQRLRNGSEREICVFRDDKIRATFRRYERIFKANPCNFSRGKKRIRRAYANYIRENA